MTDPKKDLGTRWLHPAQYPPPPPAPLEPRVPDLVPFGDRKIDWDRPETEPCQRLTPGCCIDHEPGTDWDCSTW